MFVCRVEHRQTKRKRSQLAQNVPNSGQFSGILIAQTTAQRCVQNRSTEDHVFASLEPVSQVLTPQAIERAISSVHFDINEPKLAVRAESFHKCDCGENSQSPPKVFHRLVVGGQFREDGITKEETLDLRSKNESISKYHHRHSPS